MKNILVIGLGSAGTRFIKLLSKQKHSIWAFQHYKESPIPPGCIPLADLNLIPQIDGAIIASPPYTHANYASQLLKKKIPLLIEKPITDSLSSARSLLAQAQKEKVFVMLGFNLRFLPIINTIETALRKKIGEVYYAYIHAGYSLPNWRPAKPYTKTYSAYYKQGGGSSLDLIHELDLSCNWFGLNSPNSIISKKLSDLAIDCEDYVHIAFEKPFPIHITLDYLSHIPTRIYHIVGSDGTIYCDINKLTYMYTSRNGITEALTDPALFDINDTYEQEVSFFLKHLDVSKTLVNERSLGIDALKIALKARKHV